MKRRVIVSPEAFVDQIEIAAYLGVHSFSAGERFAQSVIATFAQLKASPELGTLHKFKQSGLENVRLWPIQDFPRYLLFYQVSDDQLVILRILHSARDWAAILES